MSTPATVPMIAPDGSVGMIPSDRVNEALANGGKLGVQMRSPDGQEGIIPRENVVPAIKSGGVVLHDSAQYTTNFEKEHSGGQGGFKALGSDLLGMAAGLSQIPKLAMNPAASAVIGSQIALNDFLRKTEDRSVPYRVAAGVNEGIGVNARGMEEEANRGNTGGVIGHAAAPLVAMGAAKLGTKIAPPAADAAAQMRQKLLGGLDQRIVSEPPEVTLTRALKPSVASPDFPNTIGRTLQPLVEESQRTQTPLSSVKSVSDLAQSLGLQKKAQYENLRAPLENLRMDATPVAEAQMESIPATNLLENPGIISKTKAVADRYKPQMEVKPSGKILDEFGKPITEPYTVESKPKTLGQLDSIREDTNAKLNAFYNKAGGDRYAALSNPETARLKAVNDTTRDMVYNKLQEATGQNPAEVQNLRSDLMDVAKVAGKRETVFGRQQPFPLQEQMNVAESLGSGKFVQAAVAKLFKRYSNSDTLVQIAFDNYLRDKGLPSVEQMSRLYSPPSPKGTQSPVPFFLSGISGNKKAQ